MTPEYLSFFPDSRLAVVRNLLMEAAAGILVATLLLHFLK